MIKRNSVNIEASVNQRLLNIAKGKGEDFQRILVRYALERFLYRLYCSIEGQNFVLKGALLFEIWGGSVYRPTRDADLLSIEEIPPKRVKDIFKMSCLQKVDEDGLVFDPRSIRASTIRDEQTHGGIRIRLVGNLGPARIPLQFDVGFGDIVIPKIMEEEFPSLLSFPPPRIKAYSQYSFVAEKFQTIVVLGMANSRMKDYYDLFTLSHAFRFRGEILCKAISETFKKRQTDIPLDIPLGLSPSFYEDQSKQAFWSAWLTRIEKEPDELILKKVIKNLHRFLLPPVNACAKNILFKLNWSLRNQWS